MAHSSANRIVFPELLDSEYGDIVAVGGVLTTENLLSAYRAGIFPWPMEGWPLTWSSPVERAILRFDRLHIPKSLARLRRRSPLRFTIDRAFERVIANCASVRRRGQRGTWITPAMKRAYTEAHRAGIAHSAEAWSEDDLVGGLYGVDCGGVFSGESMFYRSPGASKLALLCLTEHLKSRGLEWLDVQVMTPHVQALGAELISRNEFLGLLHRTLQKRLSLF